jgi:hypothetical protein
MIKTSLIIIFCVVLFNGVSAQQKLPKIPDMVQIDDHTLMCEKEVDIAQWMDFIVNNGYDETLFPDTACLTRAAKLVFGELRSRTSLKYVKLSRSAGSYEKLSGDFVILPSYGIRKFAELDSTFIFLQLPITGVSFEQVQRYCIWKQDMLIKNGHRGISLSLPTVEVFGKVIPNIDSLSKNCECFRLNCSTAVVFKPSKRKIINKLETIQGHGLVPVFSYFPTSLGLYNIEGNAAEMTATQGIAIGGSFRQTARESYNDRQQNYSKPEDWLGFRYIVTTK